jgi:Up-Regulated in long-lived daf-2
VNKVTRRTFGLGTLTLAASTLTTPAVAVTRRTAEVVVVNHTGKTMERVFVLHKYSDNYKNRETWEHLLHNATTSRRMNVQYNTGFGTTGRDWWFVTWMDPEGKVFITNPHNFREVFDWFDRNAGRIGATAGGYIGGDAGRAFGRAVFEALTNEEATVGFKQHILRAEDDNRHDRPTRIVATTSEVAFVSRSGTSRTGVRRVSTERMIR